MEDYHEPGGRGATGYAKRGSADPSGLTVVRSEVERRQTLSPVSVRDGMRPLVKPEPVRLPTTVRGCPHLDAEAELGGRPRWGHGQPNHNCPKGDNHGYSRD